MLLNIWNNCSKVFKVILLAKIYLPRIGLINSIGSNSLNEFLDSIFLDDEDGKKSSSSFVLSAKMAITLAN